MRGRDMNNVVWLRPPPDDDPSEKPCLVLSEDRWWEGTLVWEPARRQDGLWWATVTYEKRGEVVTEVRSQHDVRAR
ncbi:hypothetical protein ACWEIJ_17270 [Lentzea sp. NPDC004789]